MRLKILAISDAHLGNSVSLLSSSRGRRHLGETLLRWLFPHGEAEIDELILVGDILDRAWAPLPRVRTCARDFIDTLRYLAAIGRVVYLVGTMTIRCGRPTAKNACAERAILTG